MPYTSIFPKLQAHFLRHLNQQIEGEQSAEDAEKYAFLDTIFAAAYAEAEGYCAQSLRRLQTDYIFQLPKDASGDLVGKKFLPFTLSPVISAVQFRLTPFNAWENVTDYVLQIVDGIAHVYIKTPAQGEYKVTITSGWNNADTPADALQGLTEISRLIYEQTAHGSNWFGLTSKNLSGAGQAFGDGLKESIDWKKYFIGYRIPPC